MVCLRHFFNSAFTLVPIQFLRLPDRWVPAKPWQTERINPFPTAMDLSSGKTDTYCNKVAPTARIYLHLICRKRHLPLKGKTKGLRCKTQLRTNATRGTYGFLRTLDTGQPQYAYP